jgi:hypothetical protein
VNVETIKTLKIGDPVRFTHRLERKSEHRPLTAQEAESLKWDYLRTRFAGRRLWLKWWTPVPVDGGRGRVVGIRHYRNGVNHYGEESTTFDFLTQFPVVLVAYSLHDKPAAVLPEHLTSLAAWRDRHGDVWTLGDDGLMHTRETAPFTREHVEKKWGPLVLVERSES